MNAAEREAFVTLVLGGMGLYFGTLILRGLRRYLAFRRLRPTAIVTWLPPRPANLGLLFLLGALATAVTVLNTWTARPLLHVISQALVALYFVVMVPLSLRIEWGLYEDGVWADSGFLRYTDVRLLAFREAGPIVLVLVPRRGSSPFRMLVPVSEYGVVRKVLEDKTRARLLQPERLSLA